MAGRIQLSDILRMPRYGALAEAEHYFRTRGVELEFEPAAVEAVAERALQAGGGARALRRIVSDYLRDVLFELSDAKDVTRCIVREQSIRDGSPPLLIDKNGRAVDLGIGKLRPPPAPRSSGNTAAG